MSRARDLADGAFDTLKVFDSALTDSLTLSVDTASSYAGTVTQDDTGLTFNNNTAIRGYTFKNNTSNTIISLDSDGLKFNGDTAAANALDDYEEGTWTPTVDSGTVSYTAARYLKVGDLVTAWAYNIVFSDWTSTTQVKISGLPFTSHTNSPAVGTFFARYRDNSAAIQTFIPNNAAYIRYYENSRTGGFIALSHNMFNNAANAAYITITYEAA